MSSSLEIAKARIKKIIDHYYPKLGLKIIESRLLLMEELLYFD